MEKLTMMRYSLLIYINLYIFIIPVVGNRTVKFSHSVVGGGGMYEISVNECVNPITNDN